MLKREEFSLTRLKEKKSRAERSFLPTSPIPYSHKSKRMKEILKNKETYHNSLRVASRCFLALCCISTPNGSSSETVIGFLVAQGPIFKGNKVIKPSI